MYKSKSFANLERKRLLGIDATAWLRRKAASVEDENDAQIIAYLLALAGEASEPEGVRIGLSAKGDIEAHIHSHSVTIPCNEKGVRLLKELCQARVYNPNGKLGTHGKPTQEMIDEFLKNQQLEKENKRQQELAEIAAIF